MPARIVDFSFETALKIFATKCQSVSATVMCQSDEQRELELVLSNHPQRMQHYKRPLVSDHWAFFFRLCLVSYLYWVTGGLALAEQ